MKAVVFILTISVLVAGCARDPETTAPAPVSRIQAKATVRTVRPELGDIVAFRADSFPSGTYFEDFKVGRKDLEDILLGWHQVSQDHWRHGYSHVAFGDRTGTIKLKDGTTIKWMVRPGGLATIAFQDGTVLYLARELTPWEETNESTDSEQSK